MAWGVDGADGAEAAKADANDPRIRMFTGARRSTLEPQDDLPGAWVVATPETVGRFSATAYYFGRELLRELDVPVGLVNVSWGGSTVQAWTSFETLRTLPAAARTLEAFETYQRQLGELPEGLADADLDDSAWQAVELPAMFKDIGHDIDGTIWFRRRVTLPSAWRGQALTLELGPIDDEDHTYVQGTQVGNTNGWQRERRYTIPPALTADETLTLAVRVRDGSGPGGFHGAAESMRVFKEGEEVDAVALAGGWRARVGMTVETPADQHRPAHLFHGMLVPLRDYAIRGCIWYQGENNAIGQDSLEYYELFPAFIRDLRTQLGRPELPFGLVQLPNFAENDSTFWYYPIVRDAQLRAFRSLEHVGMAITTDVGDAQDIHPRNKLDVGRRLARWALSQVYAVDDRTPTGPIFERATFAAGEARVEFRTWGAELDVKGSALGGFEVAGVDRVFHPATARVAGTSVVLRSDAVPTPAAVRYAWGNDPADATLVNGDGLPASPFRTDDWPLF